MKKILLGTIIVTCLLSALAAQSTVKLAIGDWAPFTSPTDKNGKLCEVIVTEAYKAMGYTVVYEYYPWKRSYEMVKNGEADGTLPWTYTDERAADFIFNKTGIVRDDGVYFFLKTTAFDWATHDDLKKYKMGVTIGYKDETNYKNWGIKADPATTEDQNFKKMLLGRIDAYQTSRLVGWYTIKTLFPAADAAKFTTHPKPAESSDYFALFSRKTPNGQKLADALDAGLAKIKASGRLDAIMKEYLGK